MSVIGLMEIDNHRVGTAHRHIVVHEVCDSNRDSRHYSVVEYGQHSKPIRRTVFECDSYLSRDMNEQSQRARELARNWAAEWRK